MIVPRWSRRYQARRWDSVGGRTKPFGKLTATVSPSRAPSGFVVRKVTALPSSDRLAVASPAREP